MAGIAGIVDKTKQSGEDTLKQAFVNMMQKLSYSRSQLSREFISPYVLFGNCVPLSCTTNNQYQKNDQLDIRVVIEGLLYIDSHERAIIAQHYDTHSTQSDYSLIPFMYHFYEENFVTHVTGWFNIFIYDEKRNKCLLVNDRLGFLPLYYYHSDTYFVFASKIEAILTSGLLSPIRIDSTTIAEHLFFNFPISDATYIEQIKTLSNAECLEFKQKKFSRTKYWSIGQLYGYSPENQNQSFFLMDEGIDNALKKVLLRHEGEKVNFSLTGGWDSRVILSYFLPENRKNLNTYSFGATHSADIVIPREIAQAEGFDYTAYILDQEYLNNNFLPNALKTIELSGGTRNYKRTHYLYAVQKISVISDFLVTGIFGDEVFKVTGPAAGEVLNRNMIDILRSEFKVDISLKLFSDSRVPDCLNVDRKQLTNDLVARLERLKNRMDEFESVSQKYYSFRFEYNLRKYFGYEANSCNDFVYFFSPFIDYDFLLNFSRTIYFGIHYPFGSNSILLKKQATRLYHDIVKSNYARLLRYNTGRGYSMKDSTELLGNLKIIYKRYVRKKSNTDDYNVKPTDDLFESYIKSRFLNTDSINLLINDTNAGVSSTNIFSLIYWIEMIRKRYGL